MTFYPYTQFNSAFACGAFIGNSLRETVTNRNMGNSEFVSGSSSVNLNPFCNNLEKTLYITYYRNILTKM